MFTCGEGNKYDTLKEKIKWIDSGFRYDPWFDINKMKCIQFKLL